MPAIFGPDLVIAHLTVCWILTRTSPNTKSCRHASACFCLSNRVIEHLEKLRSAPLCLQSPPPGRLLSHPGPPHASTHPEWPCTTWQDDNKCPDPWGVPVPPLGPALGRGLGPAVGERRRRTWESTKVRFGVMDSRHDSFGIPLVWRVPRKPVFKRTFATP